MKDAAKKFRKTCEKCNKPFSTANESEVLCRECRMRDDFAKRRAEDEARKEADAKSNEVFETRKCVDCGHELLQVLVLVAKEFIRSFLKTSWISAI